MEGSHAKSNHIIERSHGGVSYGRYDHIVEGSHGKRNTW